jgi:cytochrome c oxidase cbb3-type subunit I
MPALLGRPLAPPEGIRRATAGVLIGFAANWGVYMLVEHGNASHHAPGQIAALGTLLAWPAALAWWYRKFSWAEAHRRWLFSAAVWAALLVLDGWVVFLPGVLERTKFTNALVAHSHIAMAGLLTSLNFLILISLAPDSQLAVALARRGSWLAWNLACLLMITILTALGWSEGVAPRLIADGSALVTIDYLVRFGAGAVMLLASVQWLRAALRPFREP